MDWVKVSDRLPEQKGSRYIPLNLCLEEGTIVQGGFDDGVFWLNSARLENVTHWMPLPPPPKDICND